jgi:hypothetical protein
MVSKSKNGSVSFKVWISSVISTDVHELLLHLVRIKTLYMQLITRYYAIHPYFNTIKNQYLLKSVNQIYKDQTFNKRKRKIKSRKLI